MTENCLETPPTLEMFSGHLLHCQEFGQNKISWKLTVPKMFAIEYHYFAVYCVSTDGSREKSSLLLGQDYSVILNQHNIKKKTNKQRMWDRSGLKNRVKNAWMSIWNPRQPIVYRDRNPSFLRESFKMDEKSANSYELLQSKNAVYTSNYSFFHGCDI